MKSWSIRARLMAALAFGVLLLVAVNSVYNYRQARSALLDSFSETVLHSGTGTSLFISTWVGSKAKIVEATAGAIAGTTDPVAALEQGGNAGDFLSMYLVTPTGETVAFPVGSLPDNVEPGTRPWLVQARQARTAIVSTPYVHGSSGDLAVSIAQPLNQHALAADVALNEIVQELLAARLGATGYSALIDGNNNFLVHPDPSRVGENLSGLVGNTELTPEVKNIQINRESWLTAAYPIEGTTWKVVMMVKSSEALSDMGTLAVNATLLAAFTILVVIVVTGFLISYVMRPLAALDSAMSDIAAGKADLTRKLTVVRDDEFGSLGRSFNTFLDSINQLVSESLEYSEQLESLSDSSYKNATANNDAIQSQQNEIGQVAAAINEMSSTSAAVAQNAEDTAEATQTVSTEGKSAIANATENRARMSKLTDQIDTATDLIGKLDEQALDINTILSTIQNIAEQTNLLALNAAIEAARAGEQGRGFSVVADEVRALSQRTHQATGEIQAMIESLQGQSRQAVSIMTSNKTLTGETAAAARQVTLSLTAIGNSIEDIFSRAQSTAEASREQTLATEEISRIATAIQDASNHLASSVDQTKSQSGELHGLSRKIRRNLSRFNI